MAKKSAKNSKNSKESKTIKNSPSSITIDFTKPKKVLTNSASKISKEVLLVTTLVLAIIVTIMLANGSNLSSNAGTITAEEAGQKMIDFANSQGASAELISVSDSGPLYEAIIQIQGQQVPIYITKDGESFTTSLIPFDIDVSNLNQANEQAPANIEASLDSSDPVLGEANAKYIVFEYSDFECPFCERAYTDTVAGLKASDAFANGEIALVYRHFPLNSIHPNAQKAAEASICAQNQGKFWEYHDLLFENQRALTVPDLKGYASELELNQAEFDSCLDNDEAADKVAQDLVAATSSGGQGTPYFVILNTENGNTAPLSGAVPFSQIEAAIQSLG